MAGADPNDQQAVLSLIAQHEDVDALLREMHVILFGDGVSWRAVFNGLSHMQGTDFVATSLVLEDAFHRPTVDGILSALEDRCLVTNSPVSILSAAILGEKLRSLTVESMLLTDDARSLLITTIEVCRRLQSGPGFNLKTFVKSLSKEEMPNLEVIWRLHVEGLVLVESFIASNLSRPLAIKGLSQSIASLCHGKENGEQTKPIRQLVVTGLVNGLLRLDNAPADSEITDSTARGLKKVSTALLDSITKKVLLMGETSLDVSPFSELKAVNLSARNHYCTRQLNVILSTNATLKVSDALVKQCKWTSMLINPFMRTLFQQTNGTRKPPAVRTVDLLSVASCSDKISSLRTDQTTSDEGATASNCHTDCLECGIWLCGGKGANIINKQLLDAFSAQEVVAHLRRALDFQEVNWQSVLSLTAVTLITFTDAASLVGGFIQDLIGHSLDEGDPEGLIAGTLLARQACLEGPHIFMSYTDWFQKSFSGEKTTLCGSKKSFAVFCKFLSDIVPYESASYLKVHILKPPFVPAKCRPMWADYVLLAKTRLIDLKESLDDQPIDKDSSGSDKTHQLNLLIEADIEKALNSFMKNGKIPASVMEASIFRKPYFVGRFLPALLQPRPLPDIPDLRMKFIDALLKAGKLQETMFNAYKAECSKLAAQLLKGVFSDEDDDADVEMLLSVEEQLQRSLDFLRDAVIRAHSDLISTVEGARPFVRQLAAVSEKLNMLFGTNNSSTSNTPETLLINGCDSLPDGINLKAAQILLNNICQTVSRLVEVDFSKFNASWLTDLLSLIRCHRGVYSAVCCLLCHFIERRSNSLLACHLPGLAAIVFHWTRQNGCSSTMVVSSSLDKDTADSKRTSISEYVLNSMPMSRPEEMMMTTQFAVSFLKYAAKVECPSLFIKSELSLLSGKDSAGGHLSDNVEVLNRFSLIIPDRILHVISYLGPRLFAELRSLSPVVHAESMSDRLRMVSFLATEPVWRLVRRTKMSFEVWARCELEGPHDGDLSDYYDWVVFSSWHIPSFPAAGSTDPAGLQSYCISLSNALLEHTFIQGGRRMICHYCQMENVGGKSNRTGYNYSVLTQLLQKLSYVSYHQDVNQRTVPWIWSVFQQRSFPQVEGGVPASGDHAISWETEAVAFCDLLQSLPPGVLLLSFPGEKTVLGLGDLGRVINSQFRNYVGHGIALPVGLVCHILLMLVSLPEECVSQFLEECPLVLTSVLVHWTTVGHIAQSLFGTSAEVCEIAADVHRYTAGCDSLDVKRTHSKEWLHGVAAYSRILHAEGSLQMERILQLLDSTSAVTLLHCLTLDSADRLLRGEPDRADLLDAPLLVWSRFRDGLQTLCDDPNICEISSPLRLCASDTLMQLQPAICLRLLIRSLQSDCAYRMDSNWNPTCALRWYSTCAKQFTSGSCCHSSLLSILEQASQSIETFLRGMSRKQMLAVDPVVLNLLDPQMRFIFNRQFENSI